MSFVTKYDAITVDQQDRVAVITMNRPEVLNALNLQLVRELDQVITDVEQDDDIGAVVITGAGERAFSAGADIHENRELTPEESKRGTADRTGYTWHLATCYKPVIGAINGLCYGGGTVLATSLDFLIGCEKTSFRFLAVNYGQMNATWSLPTMVGWPKAKELLYSGREVFAEEAYRIGLLNHLVPSEDLLEKAVEAAAGIAKNRADGVANIKQMLMEHTGLHIEEQFRNEVDARTGRFAGLSVEDGFKDFLIGSPSFSPEGGPIEAGAAAVHLGSGDRPKRITPDILFIGESAHDRAGSAVTGDCDFNGDLIPDLVIGAEQMDRTVVPAMAVGAGKVYVIYFRESDYPNLVRFLALWDAHLG